MGRINPEKITLRQYQKDIIDRVMPDLLSGAPTVMAMSPGAGKTFTSIKIADRLIKEGKINSVLVLAHGQTALREQYHGEAVKLLGPDRVDMMQSGDRLSNKEADMVVAIPQNINLKKKIRQFDMVIVDEAHERYLADEVQDILKKIEPKYRLLLTGTPSKLIYERDRRGVNIAVHATGMQEILDHVADLQVETVTGAYRVHRHGYNDDGDVKSELRGRKETEDSLDRMLRGMIRKLHNSGVIRHPGVGNVLTANNKVRIPWLKTNNFRCLVACRSIKQAEIVSEKLAGLGFSSLTSNYENDEDSVNIGKFKNGECQFLTVVQRGVLGFDMPRLDFVLDMSGTRNLDRMYQLMSRVSRKHPDKKTVKFYMKMAPEGEREYTQHLVNAMLCLTFRAYIEKWNGKNVGDIRVPVVRKKHTAAGGGKNGSKDQIEPLVDFGSLSVLTFLRDIMHNSGADFTTYSSIRLSDLKRRYGLAFQIRYTKRLCEEKVVEKEVTSRSDWAAKDKNSYDAARRNGWLDSICEKYDLNQNDRWTYELCRQELSLKSIENISDWRRRSHSSYVAAKRNGWVSDLSKEKGLRVRVKWTQEKCEEEIIRLSITSRNDWHWKSRNSQAAAMRKGWYDDICKRFGF